MIFKGAVLLLAVCFLQGSIAQFNSLRNYTSCIKNPQNAKIQYSNLYNSFIADCQKATQAITAGIDSQLKTIKLSNGCSKAFQVNTAEFYSPIVFAICGGNVDDETQYKLPTFDTNQETCGWLVTRSMEFFALKTQNEEAIANCQGADIFKSIFVKNLNQCNDQIKD